MDVREIPVIGTIASFGFLAGDLLFYGGEIVVSLVLFAIMSPETWLSIALYAERLAGRLAFLPQGAFETLATAGLILLVLVGTYRFYQQWRESRA